MSSGQIFARVNLIVI